MKLGFDARIIIERPKGKAVKRRLVVEAAEKRRPADAAEAPMRTGRGLVVGNEFFALNPSEVGGIYASATTKRRAMRLSAHRAVAVECAGQSASDLVPNPTA